MQLVLTFLVIFIGLTINLVLDEYGGTLWANVFEIIGYYLIYKKDYDKGLILGSETVKFFV